MTTTYMAEPFGVVAPFLYDFGYLPVPIKPTFKAPMIDDWQAGHPPDHYLPQCASWGTGILTAGCPAVDLDIRDREVVRALIWLAGELLGPSPFRVGAPPKALLPFSTSSPFDKISGRWFALPGDDWRCEGYAPHRVEILATGQQFVSYARHPRGTFYRWRRGEPMDTYLIDLPEIDHASATAFLWAAQHTVRELGATALLRRDKRWFPDPWSPVDFGEPAQPSRRHDHSSERIDRDWQRIEPEDLAKLIDPQNARALKDGAWICSCPAHTSEGHRSLSITPRTGGGSIVHCFGGCDFTEIAREISNIVGRRAA
jgi:hypothetical protein